MLSTIWDFDPRTTPRTVLRQNTALGHENKLSVGYKNPHRDNLDSVAFQRI
jgi:hypothetical protein